MIFIKKTKNSYHRRGMSFLLLLCEFLRLFVNTSSKFKRHYYVILN